jgi:hypothetical protein
MSLEAAQPLPGRFDPTTKMADFAAADEARLPQADRGAKSAAVPRLAPMSMARRGPGHKLRAQPLLAGRAVLVACGATVAKTPTDASRSARSTLALVRICPPD